ncbi:hypothetical protein ACROYT_G024867 [Oculina patagonica]
MHPLLGKALLRVGLFLAHGLFFAWVFTIIERKDESSQEQKEKMLSELRTEINMKYNMTEDDFERFVRKATVAVTAGDELSWTFLNSNEFVFAALTTVGYGHITPKTPLGQGITIIMCVVGIPLTVLALKTMGELLTACIRHLVLKTETVLLKRAEPKHVKKKTFLVACTLMTTLLILTAVSSIYLENWTFIEGLYAWFTTFTTIGFGDYVLFESLARKVDQGKASEDQFIVHGFVFTLPYLIGLSLTSCILNCLVDSVDDIRDFRDRCLKCWPGLTSFIRRLLCPKRTSYDVENEHNDVNQTSYEIS